MEEARRSGNYSASIWEDDYVQSLTSPYAGGEFIGQADTLKRTVQTILDEAESQLDQLELINNLQRLDICNHFEDGVGKILEAIYLSVTDQSKNTDQSNDLHFAALRFRLLRQHGYHVPQEVLGGFMDDTGNFKARLASDVKGILSLYEASFLSVEGENILDMAKCFSTLHLKESLQRATDTSIADQVRHSLELPLHWRVQKLEAAWFIPVYESTMGADLVLIELAKLDFNMMQAKYQHELKQLSKWYKETGLQEKLGFARQRAVECFLWAVGFTPKLQFGYARVVIAEMGQLSTMMDDIYDLYGTLDELEVFTDAIQRWDINGLEQLPEYMRIFLETLFNLGNEFGHEVLRDQGIDIISTVQKTWAELSRYYYVEAQWFHSGYFPSMDEYLNRAWVSIVGPVLLLQCYLSMTNPINREELTRLEQYPSVIRLPSMVLRLGDDLGTSSDEMKRGDSPKSIHCYMREAGCCEEDARKHIKHLIDVTWKQMNKDILLLGKPVENFGAAAMNLARVTMSMYQFGDGFGAPEQHDTKKNMVSLIVEPILMP